MRSTRTWSICGATLVLRGAQAYGLRLDQLHTDVTRLAFEGAYEEASPTTADGWPLARITHGFTGKEDPWREQVTLLLSVAADGAIPAWYRVADGNAVDTRAYLAHLATSALAHGEPGLCGHGRPLPLRLDRARGAARGAAGAGRSSWACALRDAITCP